MKKISIVIIMFLVTMTMCISYVKTNGQVIMNNDEEIFVEEISEKMIRFHVLANSNSSEDQKLKMKIKNKVIEYITPKFKNVNSIELAREILIDNNDDIIKVAEDCIKENGYNYNVSTTLGRENFPVKVYGNITLPQGEYEAYRILIGDAGGENWWCVMFPPLCFVDVTKGEVSYEETENKMKNVLTDEEFEVVNNNSKLKNKKENTKKENTKKEEDENTKKEEDENTKKEEDENTKKEEKDSKVKFKFKVFDLFKNKN